MATHKSALKRDRQGKKRRLRNRAIISRMKSFVKEAETAIEEGAPNDKTESTLRIAEKELCKAASKGVIHKKAASRKVSRLAKARRRASAGAETPSSENQLKNPASS